MCIIIEVDVICIINPLSPNPSSFPVTIIATSYTSIRIPIFIIIGIGLSRIYVGVHYPSDVLAGYVLSLGLLLTVISNIDKMGEVKNGKNGSK